jgi:hypothetical protein
VPHVVAVSLDAPLLDSAALAFTRAFYLALSVGETVAEAFATGVEAVAASPHVAAAAADNDKAAGARKFAEKFELLPAGADHDERIFIDVLPFEDEEEEEEADDEVVVQPLPAPAWPPWAASKSTRPLFESAAPAPRPPEDFLGREVDTYLVVERLARRRRLVSVVGRTGLGKSALLAAATQYVSERRFFEDGVIFLKLHGATSSEQVEKALRDALARVRGSTEEAAEPVENWLDETYETLRDAKVLLVLDGPLDCRKQSFSGRFGGRESAHRAHYRHDDKRHWH